MSPVEDDPDMWAQVIRWIRPLCDGIAYIVPFLVPSFLGSLIGSRSIPKDRRAALGFWGWVNAIFWATFAGAALTPLAAHITGVSGEISNSIAVLLGILGFDRTNAIRALYRAKKAMSGQDEGEGQ